MNKFFVFIWRLLSGTLQWYILWLAHSKFVIGVTGVILDEHKKVLLIKHKYRRRDSVWGLPGGHVKSGETLEEALKREIFEETGYAVEIDRVLELKSGFKLRVEVIYLGRFLGGTLNIDEVEVDEVDFFISSQLPGSMNESHKHIIDNLNF